MFNYQMKGNVRKNIKDLPLSRSIVLEYHRRAKDPRI